MSHMTAIADDETTYLRLIEKLAHEVIGLAVDEPWFGFGEEGQLAAEPLHRAINELASHLRMRHHEGDGCVDEH